MFSNEIMFHKMAYNKMTFEKLGSSSMNRIGKAVYKKATCDSLQ